MKKIIVLIAILLSLQSQAQIDTSLSNVTVLLPVKALVIYSYYLSTQPNWADRKAPDRIIALVGTGTLPDSLVTITFQAGKLNNFITRLILERHNVLTAFNKSIFNNNPSIVGYTGLLTQISNKAAGAGLQKDAATFVQNNYNAYNQALTDVYNNMYASGLAWINN